jgi:hypothetical protein
VVGGIAYATIAAADGTIDACYVKNGGTLRVVENATDCESGERSLMALLLRCRRMSRSLARPTVSALPRYLSAPSTFA